MQEAPKIPWNFWGKRSAFCATLLAGAGPQKDQALVRGPPAPEPILWKGRRGCRAWVDTHPRVGKVVPTDWVLGVDPHPSGHRSVPSSRGEIRASSL